MSEGMTSMTRVENLSAWLLRRRRASSTRRASCRLSRFAWMAAAANLVLVLTGCGPSTRELDVFIHDYEAIVSAADYHVVPPDTIEVSSAQAPEIDGEVQSIRQDGKVSLRLLGEVKVAGLTPLEIARKLESLLSKYYVNPKVSVRVAANASKRIFVFGQVAAPGAHRYTGRDTLLTVLAAARPTWLAWTAQTKVIRPSHDKERRVAVTIDADRLMKHGDLEHNFLLQEGDIIYVPPTPTAWLGLRLQEMLFPMTSATSTINEPNNMQNAVDLYGQP